MDASTHSGVVIPNDHFFRPKPPSEMPWEMKFAERKKLSKDPRMVKHTADAAQWDGTIVGGIWKHIEKHALAINDWMMNAEQFAGLMRSWNINSEHLQRKLREMIGYNADGNVNGLVVCKYLELLLTSPQYKDIIAAHCYNLFDRPDDVVVPAVVANCQLAPPPDPNAKKAGRAKKSTLPTQMKAGAMFHHVEALKVVLSSIPLKDPEQLTLEEFAKAFYDLDNVFLVTACAQQVLEVLASRCCPPHGQMPLLSMRWLKTVEPVQAGGDMYDADISLLREMELAGGDAVKSKKGRGSPRRAA